jgi:hypothetical protein
MRLGQNRKMFSPVPSSTVSVVGCTEPFPFMTACSSSVSSADCVERFEVSFEAAAKAACLRVWRTDIFGGWLEGGWI